MNAFLIAWALCATVASFVVLGVVVALEVRDHHTPAAVPVLPGKAPRFTIQRRPLPAAVIVAPRDGEAFEEFLGELIVTPHVEEALSW